MTTKIIIEVEDDIELGKDEKKAIRLILKIFNFKVKKIREE